MWLEKQSKMTKDQIEFYFVSRERFKHGEITLSEWRIICEVLLGEIMEENRSDKIYEGFIREYL